MLRVFFLITFICFFQSLIAQTIRIGLFTGSKIKELQLQIGQGSYLMQVKAENSGLGLLKQINPDDTYLLKPYNGMVQVYSKGQLFLQGETILLQQKNLEDFCNWTILSPSSKMRSYEGDFELVNFKGDLRLINNLDIETYLEGVVSSEGGDGQRLAYYEAQAVISRTYALSNLNRHQNENFALCERVHCQAYLNNKQAHWVKSIPLHQWTDFLVEKYNFPVFDSSSVALMQAFRQDQRMAFYLNPVYGIPLRDLRDHFKLKSTFFDAIIVGQEVILYGKGFGHGVGLCQEGAMQMARKGYTFDQILRFYYPNASLAK